MPTASGTEYLELNYVPGYTPAWLMPDLSMFWVGAAKKGSNRPIPHKDGDAPTPRRKASRRVLVDMTFFGSKDSDGNTWADPWFGLWQNIGQWRELVVDDPGDSLSRIPAVMYVPDGFLSGLVQVEDFELVPPKPDEQNPLDPWMGAVLDLTIAAGELEPAAS
jgi:hypothetical protein